MFFYCSLNPSGGSDQSALCTRRQISVCHNIFFVSSALVLKMSKEEKCAVILSIISPVILSASPLSS